MISRRTRGTVLRPAVRWLALATAAALGLSACTGSSASDQQADGAGTSTASVASAAATASGSPTSAAGSDAAGSDAAGSDADADSATPGAGGTGASGSAPDGSAGASASAGTAASGTAVPSEDRPGPIGADDTAGGKAKVIMDVDMGQLNDDAVAMFMLTQSADTVDLLGVTTVAGNTWLEEGTQYSLRQLELVDRQDVPVLMGAGEPLMGNRQPLLDAEEAMFGNSEYLGSWGRERPASYTELAEEPYGGYAETEPGEQHAVNFLAEQVRANPHEVTIFALGPATNLALLARMYPDVVPLVKQVIYMGGAIDIPGNTTPAAEFNWWYDPEAIKIALRAPFPMQTVVPNDVAEAVYYTKKRYDAIVAGADTPITQMFVDRQGERWAEDPDDESFVWDSITAAIFLQPSIATEVEQRYLDIDTTLGPNYGRAIGYHDSRRRDTASGEGFPVGTQKVNIVFDIDREAFWELYTGLMGAPLPE